MAKRCWANCPGWHSKETGLERWPERWGGPEHVGAFPFYLYCGAKAYPLKGFFKHGQGKISIVFWRRHRLLSGEWIKWRETSFESNAVVQVRGNSKLRWWWCNQLNGFQRYLKVQGLLTLQGVLENKCISFLTSLPENKKIFKHHKVKTKKEISDPVLAK